MSFDIPQTGSGVEPKTVNAIHQRSDVDSASTAQHHTLGIKNTQSSPGDHIHDGRSSKKLLEGVNLTGNTSSYNENLLQQIISALEELGATDSTTT